jgi:hypothetical protein
MSAILTMRDIEKLKLKVRAVGMKSGREGGEK